MIPPATRFSVGALAAALAIGCAEATAPSGRPVQGASAVVVASGPATHTEGPFFGTAMCFGDIGYNIRFGGPHVLVRHVSGTDTTRSFRTQEFQGWRMPQNTLDYEVLGGAEMFNIKRGEDGTLDVRIHEGTLVFAALDGSHKVVARHEIRFVPGQGEMVNAWSCKRVGVRDP